MVDNIKAAFAKRVDALDWMAPATKAEARKKVETIIVGVGYPDTWRDYSALADQRRRRLRQCQQAAGLARISPPDRQDRQADRPPRMVDAAAAGQRGQPAAAERAQLPGRDPRAAFFDPKADAAFNYGAIGSVIGHEISHSFDNLGAVFDSTGRAAQLVDPGRLRALQPSRRGARRQYRRL